jgi:phage I-like protein
VKRFFWGERVDATGRHAEGIWADVEWSKEGKDAVEGKSFRTFSPTFFVDAIRNSPERPARIVCNENARANMGALENDPAFQTISPLWCRSGGGSKKPDEVKTIVRGCLTELRASRNPTLDDLCHELYQRHKVKLGTAEVGALLID